MMQIFEIAVLIASIAIFALAGFLFLEIIGAMALRRRRVADDREPGPIAVVIPAHNEAASIKTTLSSVLSQARETDRVIVVADNCHDNTAELAAQSGAECWERVDEHHRGKGYALQFALDGLKDAPPQTVVFIDADCTLADGALSKLAAASENEDRPVQALYLMQPPGEASPRLRVAAFAWAFLNHARMRGLDRLFGVSRITGAGIALPWRIASSLNVGSGEIVEDLALTLTLTEQKTPPLLLLDALVTSEFPMADDALAKQRARWEHGSQNLAARRAAPCFVKGVLSGNLRLSVIAMDLMIPPIVNLFGLILTVFVLSIAAFFTGAVAPFGFSLGALVLLSVSVVAGWFVVGRQVAPLSSLTGLLPFLAAKGRIYGAEGRTSAKQWTPTRSGGVDGNTGE
ncbi:MAG: glycosyltransferase family 2 protein [Pseudomonadota bacterium]